MMATWKKFPFPRIHMMLHRWLVVPSCIQSLVILNPVFLKSYIIQRGCLLQKENRIYSFLHQGGDGAGKLTAQPDPLFQ